MAIQAIQVFGQGCLSRTIVSHQGHSVAGVNDEIDPIQSRLSIRVTVRKGADLKKRRSRLCSSHSLVRRDTHFSAFA